MIMNFIVWLIIGGLAGWVASKFMKTDAQMGLVANVVAGIVGAMLGGWLSGMLFNYDPTGNLFSVPGFIVAVVGAMIVIFLVQMLTGRRTV